MLLLVLVATGLGYATAALTKELNISSCPWNVFGVNYDTVYVSVNTTEITVCTLGYFNPNVPNVCVHQTSNSSALDDVDLGIKQTAKTESFTTDTSVTITGSRSCDVIVRYLSMNKTQIINHLSTYDPTFGVFSIGGPASNITVKAGDISISESHGGGWVSTPVLLLGCTDGSTFVNSNSTACSGDRLKTCPATYNDLSKKKCVGGCLNGGCVNRCSVLGSNVIDVNGVKGAISERCGYTLLSNGPVQLGAVFRDRRRTDVPLLDHLELSVGSTKIRLGPGVARVQVNGSMVNISTALMPQGVTVSRTSSGISLHYQQMFELVFDGYSALLYVTDPTGLTGLCINATDVSAAESAALSSAGCDTVHQQPPDASINCVLAKQRCELLNSSHFSDCHSMLDPSLFMETCEELLCKYPSVDGFDCAFHEAYAVACSKLNVTLPEWRTSAGCGSGVDFCRDTYCSDHEFCGGQRSDEKCFCRALFAAKYNGTLGDPTVCSQNSASLSLVVCLLANKGIHYHELHLNNPNCTGELDVTSHMLNFGFDTENMCGTEVTSENNQLVFKNKVVLKNHTTGMVTRHNQFQLDFSCYYDQPEIKTVALKIKDSSVVQTIVSGLWSYNLTMKAYLDLSRTKPIAPSTELQLDQTIWVELRAEGLDENLVSIVTDSCWGTSQQPSNSTPRYDLVKSGCPNLADGSVKVRGNGLGTSNMFSFNMFQFTGSSTEVYLHCKVSLCVTKGGCVPPCGGAVRRRRRSLIKDPNPALITMSWTN